MFVCSLVQCVVVVVVVVVGVVGGGVGVGLEGLFPFPAACSILQHRILTF